MDNLWQWHDALGVKEDMPRCSDGCEILFGKPENHAFLAKLSNALKRNALLMASFQHDMFVHSGIFFFNKYCSSASLSI